MVVALEGRYLVRDYLYDFISGWYSFVALSNANLVSLLQLMLRSVSRKMELKRDQRDSYLYWRVSQMEMSQWRVAAWRLLKYAFYCIKMSQFAEKACFISCWMMNSDIGCRRWWTGMINQPNLIVWLLMILSSQMMDLFLRHVGIFRQMSKRMIQVSGWSRNLLLWLSIRILIVFQKFIADRWRVMGGTSCYMFFIWILFCFMREIRAMRDYAVISGDQRTVQATLCKKLFNFDLSQAMFVRSIDDGRRHLLSFINSFSKLVFTSMVRVSNDFMHFQATKNSKLCGIKLKVWMYLKHISMSWFSFSGGVDWMTYQRWNNSYFQVGCNYTSRLSQNFRGCGNSTDFNLNFQMCFYHCCSLFFLISSRLAEFLRILLNIIENASMSIQSLWLVQAASNYEFKLLIRLFLNYALEMRFQSSAEAYKFSILKESMAAMESCILKSGKYIYSIISLMFLFMFGRCSNLSLISASFCNQ